MKMSGSRRSISLLLFLVGVFLLYSNSFNTFRILERKHSVLGEADSAAFIMIMQDFHLDKKYGEVYKTGNRELGDVAQKHKIHHPLYIITASLIYEAFQPAYRFLGKSPTDALYAVNAFLSCINLLLLYLLLRRLNPDRGNVFAYLGMYVFSLSPWIYGSVPESWTLSATLVLAFLYLLYGRGINRYALSAFIGIAMVNNIFLCTLFVFLLFDAISARRPGEILVGRLAAFVLVSVATWAVLLAVLSIYDSSLGPVEYLKFTFWWKSEIAPPIKFFKLYYWKVALSNLFITSFLSNQSLPVVPQEAILYTIRGSRLGLAATILFLGFLLYVSWSIGRYLKVRYASGESVLSENPTVPMALFCAGWTVMTVILDTSGALLFSSIVVPVVVVLASMHFDTRRRFPKAVLCLAISSVVVNNIDQVLKFRDALRLL
jgi:hypothetical protein